MRILQLCKKFPYPLKDGEAIAVTYLAQALSALGGQMTLLSMNTVKHHFDITSLPSHFNHYNKIHLVEIDNSIKPIAAFLNLFSKESYHISRFISKDYKSKLIEVLKENYFDIIQLESPYLAPYIPTIRANSNAKVVMRSHNVEFEIWERITMNTTFFLKKWYLQLLTKRLRNYEIEQLGNYDLLVSITQRDLERFENLGYKGDSHVSPIGLDVREYMADGRSFDRPLSLSFIGSLDWMPNLEGVLWFIDNVWEKAIEKYPNLTLHIAGRNTPEWLLKKNWKNVHIHGEVESAKAFINEHSIMLVPLLSGSGMRAKILEGMILGKAVLTTSIGVEGIEAKHKDTILLADTPQQFLEALAFAMNDPKRLLDLGQKAQVFISKYYDNLNIGKALLTRYSELIGVENKITLPEESTSTISLSKKQVLKTNN